MGKNDFMSPKAIGNRIKAKGLQKLRWYCQLCQKQCRDENGFKCHQMSDSHRRQMELFGQSANKVVADYSTQFEQDFLDHLKMAHPFSRVAAKVVYNEFIQDRNHVHMNSTKWLTLTGFINYLGREGKCKVDETPKGWFITLIHRDPKEELSEEKKLKRLAAEKEEEERHLAALNDQVERARKMARMEEAPDPSRILKRDENEGPLVLGINLGSIQQTGIVTTTTDIHREVSSSSLAASAKSLRQSRPVQPTNVFDDDEDGGGPSGRNNVGVGSTAIPLKMSKIEALMKKELEAKAAKTKNDQWLTVGIIVKVMSKALKEHGYYKMKGEVIRVIDRYIGEISMLDSGDVVRVDQQELETVIPSPGGSILVLNGLFKGSRGSLLSIDTTRFQAHIKLNDGPDRGKEAWLEYEDISKLA